MLLSLKSKMMTFLNKCYVLITFLMSRVVVRTNNLVNSKQNNKEVIMFNLVLKYKNGWRLTSRETD